MSASDAYLMIVSLCLFFSVLLFSLSDNGFSVQKRGGKTWREHNIAIHSKSLNNVFFYIWDNHLYSGPPIYNWITYFIFRRSPKFKVDQSWTKTTAAPLLGTRLIALHYFLILYLLFRSFDGYALQIVSGPKLLLYLITAYMIISKALYHLINYYTILLFDTNVMIVIRRTFLRKATVNHFKTQDIKTISVQRNYLFFPNTLDNLRISFSDGSSVCLKSAATNLNLVELLKVNSRISIN